MQKARESGKIVGVFSLYSADEPKVFLDIDREKLAAYHVNIKDLFDTLNIFLGSAYINNINRNNKAYHVYVQGNPAARSSLDDLEKIYVPNKYGNMAAMTKMAMS